MTMKANPAASSSEGLMTDEAVLAPAEPATATGRGPLATVGLLILLGVVIRLALAPWFGGFGYDIKTFRDWTEHLLNDPLSQFYFVADSPDHLPGDLWLLLGAGKVYAWLGGTSFRGIPFLLAVKAVPVICDVVVALLLYAIVGARQGVHAGITALTWAILNPAFIFLTGIWGQWDAVSGALFLAGTLIVFRRDGSWYWSAPLFAWAMLVKPQMALLAAVVYLIPLLDAWQVGTSIAGAIRVLWWRVLAAGALGVATISLLALPFRVGLPGFSTRWTLLGRIQEALNLYPKITLGACNIWMIYAGSLHRFSDVRRTFLGLTPHTWGNILFALAMVFILWTMARQVRRAVVPVIAWTALATAFAFFMLPTRVHERYLFPAVILAILLAGLVGFPRWGKLLAGAFSASYLFNLVIVYGGFRPSHPGAAAMFIDHVLFRGLSLANVALFIAVLALPYTNTWRDSVGTWRGGSEENHLNQIGLPVGGD